MVFEWVDECKKAFHKLKKALILAPILQDLDWNKIFHVHIDAFNFATSYILAQVGVYKMDFQSHMHVAN